MESFVDIIILLAELIMLYWIASGLATAIYQISILIKQRKHRDQK